MAQPTRQDVAAEIISPRLLELLVCPVDKQPVRVDGASLVCTVCDRVYPVEDGIPNMLIDDEG